MRELASGVHLVPGLPPNAINVYVVGGVLVDAATRRAGRRILKAVAGRDIRTHVVTHAHPDHQGATHEVATALNLPVWAGHRDADAIEDPGLIVERSPSHPLNVPSQRWWLGPAHPVARGLREGDEVGGFTVLETPGHSIGHIVLWRESDRTLIGGDVITTMNVTTGLPGLHEPLARFTPDPVANRAAIRRIAALEPRLALFGHGRPLRDPDALLAFAASLPADAVPSPAALAA